MSRVKAMRIVDAPIEDVFNFTDWCYNNPEWVPFIHKSWIITLPHPDGLGKIIHYVGEMMARKLEWEARSVKFESNRHWGLKAVSRLPAKMNMESDMQFEALEPRKTRITLTMQYRVPYPLIGWFIDRFFIRRETQKMADAAAEGIQKMAINGRIPLLSAQMEKRKVDHPRYRPS